MHRQRVMFGLLSLTLLVGGVVVFGGSAVAGAQGTSGSTPGVTAHDIKVGGIVTFTSASGFSEAGVDLGAKARFEQQNAEGGVDGRKIDYIGSKDDGLNPATDLQLAQQLVESDHVFAVVPVGAPAFTGAGNYLVQSQVPFIGWGTTPPFCDNTYGFGIFGCDVAIGSGAQVSTATGGLIGAVLHGTKGKTVAIISSDNEAGAASLPSSAAGLKAAGFDVVYAKPALPAGAVTDYTPYADALMTANNGSPPDAIFYSLEEEQVLGMRAAMAAAGYKGIELDGVTYDPDLLTSTSTRTEEDGEYSLVPFEPFQSDTPAVKTMVDAFKKVAGPGVVPSEYMAYGYWMADMFIAMLKKTGHDLTSATFQAATSDFNYQVPGGVGRVSFPADHSGPSPCSALVEAKGFSFVTKVPLTCYSTVPLASAS